jgi:hypothetical protein
MLKLVSVKAGSFEEAKKQFEEKLKELDSVQGVAVYNHEGMSFEILSVVDVKEKSIPEKRGK